MNLTERPDDPRWLAVHERLDAGLDPLEDPLVAEACSRDPEFGGRLAEMLVVLESLAPTDETGTGDSDDATEDVVGWPRGRRHVALLAGAAVILTALLVFVFADSPPTSEQEARSESALAPLGRLTQAAILDRVRPARLVNARFRTEHWSGGRVRGGERLLVPSQQTDATRRWGRSPRDSNDDRIRTVGGLRVTSWSSTGTTSNSR